MKNLIYVLLIFAPFLGFGQESREFSVEFKPKQHSLSSKEKYTKEIDGLYKFWMYYVEVNFNGIDEKKENYSIQFVQDNFESEIYYSDQKSFEIRRFMPSSYKFYALGKVYNKVTNQIIRQDTIHFEAQDHVKLDDCDCEALMIPKTKIEDGIQWRFCANRMQFSRVGEKIENFSFEDINEKRYNLNDFKNKIVFINAWFIGCVPCIGELPLLKELASRYENDKEIVFLTFVRTEKNKLLSKKKLYGDSYDNFIMVSNDNFHLEDYFGMTGYPTNYILDKKGVFRFMTNGYPLLKGMQYKDYKKGFINEHVLTNYIDIISKLKEQ